MRSDSLACATNRNVFRFCVNLFFFVFELADGLSHGAHEAVGAPGAWANANAAAAGHTVFANVGISFGWCHECLLIGTIFGTKKAAFGLLKRTKGIEPSYAAWEAAVLPLNYARMFYNTSMIAKARQPVKGARGRMLAAEGDGALLRKS